MTKTRRLPRTLKKKLEASLTKLTPKEAGRLHLIYMHEADKKNALYSIHDYPPIAELEDAWRKRIEAAKKKGPAEGNHEIALFNGFFFLQYLALAAQDWAERESYKLSSMTFMVMRSLDTLFLKDTYSEAARRVVDVVTHENPAPVSREDFARLLAWAAGPAHWELSQVADQIVKVWAEAQGFFEVDFGEDEVEDLIRSRPEEALELLKDADPEDEDEQRVGRGLRRLYADENRDRLLKDVFKGDVKALDAWAEKGSWAGLDPAVLKAKEDEVFAQLVAMVKAGDLEGGEAVSLEDVYDSNIVAGGKLPAWAALRSLWRGWLVDHDYMIRLDAKITRDALRGVMSASSIDGDLEGEALVNVVAEFVADCRAKPWGEGLAQAIDFAGLARFLVEVYTPLQADQAPDLGLVDLEAFKEAEGEDPFISEGTFWVTTNRSLTAKAGDLGIRGEAIDQTYLITGNYYPTDRPEERRAELARVTSMLQSLQTSHRPFTYGENQPPSLLGSDFVTPLEEAIKHLGEAFGEDARIRLVFDILSDKYFDGLPVLVASTEERLTSIEQLLEIVEDEVKSWLHKIERDPWNIDTATLQPVRLPANEEKARTGAALVISMAQLPLGGPHIDIDLGEGLVDPHEENRKILEGWLAKPVDPKPDAEEEGEDND